MQRLRLNYCEVTITGLRLWFHLRQLPLIPRGIVVLFHSLCQVLDAHNAQAPAESSPTSGEDKPAGIIEALIIMHILYGMATFSEPSILLGKIIRYRVLLRMQGQHPCSLFMHAGVHFQLCSADGLPWHCV
jgi:hypothetical protein